VFAAEAGQRLTKLLTLAGACFIVLAAGGALFVWGMFSFTTPRFWAGALENTISAPSTVSIWWGGPPIGPLGPQLFGFGVMGVVTAVLFGDRLLRGCASGLLLFVAAIFLLGYVAVTFGNWRGPQSVYFEFLVWPLYAIFAVWGVTYWLSRLAALGSPWCPLGDRLVVARVASSIVSCPIAVGGASVLEWAPSGHTTIDWPTRWNAYARLISGPPMLYATKVRLMRSRVFPAKRYREVFLAFVVSWPGLHT
jgi:hypothetical protein